MTCRFLRLSVGFGELLKVGVTFVAVCTVTAFLGRSWWLLDMTSNFRVQYVILLVLSAILLAVGKRWSWAIVAIVFALVNVLDILPAFIGGKTSSTSTSRQARVLLANVMTSNTQYDKVRRLIRSENPDVIAALEVSEIWMKELAAALEDYPHVISRPRSDNFGIAVYSRFPFQKAEILDFGRAELPTVVARLSMDKGELTVIATHPLPPIGSVRAGYRNRQLEALASYIHSVDGPVVLVGDLNTTPWSPHFKRLLREAGLRDSRNGQGIQPTWPTELPSPLRVPLDHVLHSEGLTTLRRKTGPRVGSDHLPVIVDLALGSE
jgi:endonuclease/exonuclease/phosphatase (EEP) superfamily protein YafD